VLLPQAKPALTTLGVLVFMWTWNEFLLALVMIQSEGLRTAPLGLAVFSGANRQTAPTVVAAAAVLVALPIVIVYLFLQRSFIRGMFAGSVNE
jgi:raffinose/stachyose/melibiose transport system permease protein